MKHLRFWYFKSSKLEEFRMVLFALRLYNKYYLVHTEKNLSCSLASTPENLKAYKLSSLLCIVKIEHRRLSDLYKEEKFI